LSVVKFHEGGWGTLVATGAVIAAAFLTHRHYERTRRELARLDDLASAVNREMAAAAPRPVEAAMCDPAARTAVVLVNGFNGLGLHTLLNITRLFPGMVRNSVFLHVGVVDAGNFKGAGEIENLRRHIAVEAERYADYMRRQGFHAEAVTDLGTDVVQTASVLGAETARRFPNAVFFGGQLVFEREFAGDAAVAQLRCLRFATGVLPPQPALPHRAGAGVTLMSLERRTPIRLTGRLSTRRIGVRRSDPGSYSRLRQRI
jgi:hypothetical protein